jgi:holo-[acyl-carrier protein] synthase
MAPKVGLDLVEVEDVRSALRVHGQRYLERIYTAQEIRACRGSARALARRFAVKEAVIKALGAPDGLPWQSIDVALDGPAQVSITLRDAAAELAQTRGVRALSASVVGQRSTVAAIVLAELFQGRDDRSSHL